jgi:hypothetical protein
MTFFSPEQQYFYDILVEYYDNPNFYKIKDNEDVSVFGVRVPSLLLNENHYLICTCPKTLDTVLPLREIPWLSFQTRTTDNEMYSHLPKIQYKKKGEQKFQLPLQIVSRDTKISSYKTVKETPLEVSLLHVKGLEYEYANEGNLQTALETYQTILQLK